MALCINSFVTSGISGVIGLNGKNTPNKLKTKICTLVLQGLHECI